MPENAIPVATPSEAVPTHSDNLSLADLAQSMTAKRAKRPAPPAATAPAPQTPPAEAQSIPPAQPTGQAPAAPIPPQPSPAAVEAAPEADETNPTDPYADPAAPEAADPNAPPADPATEVEAAPTLPKELAEFLADAKTGKAPKELARRVHKLVDQRDTERNTRLAAEQRAQQLEAELKDARETKANVVPLPGAGVDAHPQLQQLHQQIEQLNGLIGWTRQNQLGGTLGEGDQARDYDAAAVQAMQQNAQDRKAELIAERTGLRQQLQARHQQQEAAWDQAAVSAYPWLADAQSEEFKMAKEIATAAPWIRQHPSWPMRIGDMVAGARARMARKPANQPVLPTRKPAPAREPTPQAGRPAAAAPRVSPRLEHQQQQETAEATGRVTMEDQALLFSGKRRASRAAA